MATMILVLGIALAVCGQAWLIYIAYRHSVGWAIACFIPFVALVFAIMNWEEYKFPLGAQFLGLIITYNIISSSPLN